MIHEKITWTVIYGFCDFVDVLPVVRLSMKFQVWFRKIPSRHLPITNLFYSSRFVVFVVSWAMLHECHHVSNYREHRSFAQQLAQANNKGVSFAPLWRASSTVDLWIPLTQRASNMKADSCHHAIFLYFFDFTHMFQEYGKMHRMYRPNDNAAQT